MKFRLIVLFNLFFCHFFAQKDLQDIDGNSYQVIRIDSTEWITSNLKTTRFQMEIQFRLPKITSLVLQTTRTKFIDGHQLGITNELKIKDIYTHGQA